MNETVRQGSPGTVRCRSMTTKTAANVFAYVLSVGIPLVSRGARTAYEALAGAAATGGPAGTSIPVAAASGSIPAVLRPRLGGMIAQFVDSNRDAPLDDHHGVRLRQRTGLRAQSQVFALGRRLSTPIVDCRFNLHQGEFGHPFILSCFRAGASIRARTGVPALLHSTDCAVMATASSVFPIV